MTNFSIINQFSGLAGLESSQSQSSGRSGPASGAFQHLLQGMLQGDPLISPEQQSVPGMSGFRSEAWITPILLGLYAQLEDENRVPDVPAGWNNFPARAADGPDRGGYSRNVPAGDPVQGRISQNVRPGHRALDYAVVVGTPVKATLSGRIKKAGWDPDGYGRYIVVENGPYEVYFAHLSEFNAREGDWIEVGQVIGRSGNTGNSTGPHLHYEIRKNGRTIDPRPSRRSWQG